MATRSNEDPLTRHSSTPTTTENDGWLDVLQVFSHRGEVYINEKGKKDVMLNGRPKAFDKGWDTKTRDTNFVSTSIACILGEPSGVCVLDFDDTSLYDELMAEYADRCWPTVKTKRGRHVYFIYSGHTREAFDGWPSNIGKTSTDGGVDIKRNGQIWFPGCRVKQRDGSYFRYEWIVHDRLTNGVGLLCHMPCELIDTLSAMAKTQRKLLAELPTEPRRAPPPIERTQAAAPSADASRADSLVSAYLNPDQKRAALITGEHVLDNKTWYLIVCAMRKSQCTYEDAVALTNRYLQASGKSQTSRFERLRAGWDGVMAESNATMGTIIHHAKLCNQDALKALRRQEKAADNEPNKAANVAAAATENASPVPEDGAGLFEDGGDATDLQLARAFLELQGDNFIYQRQTMYAYFESRWRVDKGCELLSNVYMHTMTEYLASMLKNTEKRSRQQIAKALYACQTPYKVNGMIAAIKSILAGKLHAVQFDVGPEQHYNIQFRDCVYDLKKKEPRPRTASDYITQTLDYDFMPRESISEEVHREVRRFYEKLQPDETQRRFQLGYLAYALTGNTSHQIAKLNIGYSAGNGKSTELKVHRTCFGIYTTKLDKRTFNKNYEKAHKEFIGLLRNPVRLAFIEELDRDKIDEDLYKDFVDGSELSVEILYDTKALAPHQAKLMTCSNKDPNINADAGVKRRTKCQLYTTRFVEGVEDNDETHVYRKERAFEERFKAPEYRNAYFHLLLEHVDELVVPQSAAELFSQISEENDEFRNTLEMDFEMTNDPADRLSRRQVMEAFTACKSKRMEWPDVLQHLKRLGMQYVRDERIQSAGPFESVIRERGVIHGIRPRQDEEDEAAPGNQTSSGGEPSTHASLGISSFVSRCHT